MYFFTLWINNNKATILDKIFERTILPWIQKIQKRTSKKTSNVF